MLTEMPYKVSDKCTAVCPDGTPLCDYNGTVSVTSGGRNCRNWTDIHVTRYHMHNVADMETLEKSVNYCRNYGYLVPWCYTFDPETYNQGCGETICKGIYEDHNFFDYFILNTIFSIIIIVSNSSKATT